MTKREDFLINSNQDDALRVHYVIDHNQDDSHTITFKADCEYPNYPAISNFRQQVAARKTLETFGQALEEDVDWLEIPTTHTKGKSGADASLTYTIGNDDINDLQQTIRDVMQKTFSNVEIQQTPIEQTAEEHIQAANYNRTVNRLSEKFPEIKSHIIALCVDEGMALERQQRTSGYSR